MSKILPLLLLFLPLILFSQSYIVTDVKSGHPLSFVSVLYDNTGFYTGKDGVFEWPVEAGDSLSFRHIGYESVTIHKATLHDNKVALVPKPEILGEVVIDRKKENRVRTKPSKKGGFTLLLNETSEHLIFITPEKDYANALVEEITFLIARKHHLFDNNPNRKDFKEAEAYVRVNVYRMAPSDDNGKARVGEALYSSQPVNVSGYNKDDLVIYLYDAFIELSESGLCFGLEFIGYYNNGQQVESSSAYIRPLTTTKSNKFFSGTTYVRYVFKNQEEMTSIEELIKKGGMIPADKAKETNLSIGLKLLLE